MYVCTYIWNNIDIVIIVLYVGFFFRFSTPSNRIFADRRFGFYSYNIARFRPNTPGWEIYCYAY